MYLHTYDQAIRNNGCVGIGKYSALQDGVFVNVQDSNGNYLASSNVQFSIDGTSENNQISNLYLASTANLEPNECVFVAYFTRIQIKTIV